MKPPAENHSENFKYLILGGRGFLGSELTNYLKNQQKFVYETVFDISGAAQFNEFIKNNQVDVILNAAGISDYQTCENEKILSFNVNAAGVLNILESLNKFSPATRFLNFGSIREFDSFSWYSETKKISREIINFYREQHELWAAQLYLCHVVGKNQKTHFVIPKIIKKIKEIKNSHETHGKNGHAKKIEKLKLGNINSEIKILHVDNACELILKAAAGKQPEDYLLNGIKITVKEFLELAFARAGVGWEDFVEIDEKLFRPKSNESYLDIVGLTLKKEDKIDNILNKLLG